MNWKRWIGIAALAASTLANAQDPQFSKNPTDFHSAATIHEDAAKLLEQAKPVRMGSLSSGWIPTRATTSLLPSG